MAAAVLAGIGAAVTGSEDHRTGHTAIGEAIGKAEKWRRGGHFFMALLVSLSFGVEGGVNAGGSSFNIN